MEQNYGALYADAIAQSGSGSEVLPDDTYNVRVAAVKPGNAANGKFRVGLRLEVLDGPQAGKSTWVNQTFSPTDKNGQPNPKAIAVFLRILQEFGVPDHAIAQGLPPETLVTYIATGTLGRATLSYHTFGLNDDQTPKKFQDVKKFVLTGVEGAALPGSPPVVQTAAAPAPAPAPEAPAPTPQVSPAAAPQVAPVPAQVAQTPAHVPGPGEPGYTPF